MSWSVPDDAIAAARWLAHGAMRGRRWEVARDLLLGCVTATPGDRWSAVALVRVAIHLGDLRLAEDAVRFAGSRHPDDPELRLLEARLALARGDREQARDRLLHVDGAAAAALRARLHSGAR